MFENLFKKNQKSNDDNLVENNEDYKEFHVSDLYTAYPALISIKYEEDGYVTIYNGQSVTESDVIVVKFISRRYVENILTGRQYGIFHQFESDELKKFVGQFMVNNLTPLEMVLIDKTKTTLTRQEIRELLYPKSKKKDEKSKYSDVIIQKIGETNQKVNSSSIDEEEKEKIGKELISIANYYVNTLKMLSGSNKQSLGLTVNQKSIIDLKKECMERLVEIEIMLPPENINTLMNELSILEQSILKRK